ncbi:MAG TPA: ribosome biogenesis factor YjgA [Ramlibacter sp.]|jgi:ribosome-associated protein
MSRKPKKGYFVQGHFVAEGSDMDLLLEAERTGGERSRTELKKESDELQKLGEALLTLPTGQKDRLGLPEKLLDALEEARRITNFEGRRRQMQYVGKLMRHLDAPMLAAVRDALDEQRGGSAQATLALHMAETWRDELIADDDALSRWLEAHPETDVQQLRALVRQARKDTQPDADAIAKGLAPRRGRAYRDIFQIVRDALDHPDREEDD